ncbi:MAG: tRNA (adenosine(37)-N6)-threonylcarbamoyltransferase complex dimerization subunit type 1 TsaB, partial [Longispora sp.]|nr:tRNA (adenosine(37)-N6)-threonylcarbamoyltransferase complex dimerization subunit type 1 TsaB [Longispora sp. (in: high G+C Gram-positive bacteria)]
MLVLVTDTATAAVTAGLVSIGEPTGPGDIPVEVLASRVTVDGKAHGELLAPSIAASLTEAGYTPKDLTAVIAGVGPGPFTGLRVGLVTATAMGHALGIPTYG